MTNEELHWVAGWLEGEGSFFMGKNGTAAIVQAFSTDRDVIERVAKLIGGAIHYIKPRAHYAGWISSEGWRVHLESEPAISLMKQVQPLMCVRRQAKIVEVLNAWENRSNKPFEKPCSCGCGEKLIASPRKIYINATHAVRAWRHGLARHSTKAMVVR